MQHYSADHNGAEWCCVDSLGKTCRDLQPSKRFPNNPWSYEACTTPPREGSFLHKCSYMQGSRLSTLSTMQACFGCFTGPLYPPAHHGGIFTIAGAVAEAVVGGISRIGAVQHATSTTATSTTTTTITMKTNTETTTTIPLEQP